MSKHSTKLLLILFALILATFLPACGANNTSSTDTATDSPAVSASDTTGADINATETASQDAGTTDTTGMDVSPTDSPSPSDTTGTDMSSSDSLSPSDTTGTDVSPSDSPSSSDSATQAKYPKVTPDNTSISVGETVTFKVVTSQNVKKIQAIIDGNAGKSYTSYKTVSGLRNWTAKITFTAAGNRKVQFKCSMVSGSMVMIPSNAVVLDVSSTTSYTVSPASKTINNGSSVIFILDTPASITSVYAVIDGVKQGTVSKPSSNSSGFKKWKVNITFHKTGSRNVIFKACAGSTVNKSFPDTPIAVTVN